MALSLVTLGKRRGRETGRREPDKSDMDWIIAQLPPAGAAGAPKGTEAELQKIERGMAAGATGSRGTQKGTGPVAKRKSGSTPKKRKGVVRRAGAAIARGARRVFGGGGKKTARRGGATKHRRKALPAASTEIVMSQQPDGSYAAILPPAAPASKRGKKGARGMVKRVKDTGLAIVSGMSGTELLVDGMLFLGVGPGMMWADKLAAERDMRLLGFEPSSWSLLATVGLAIVLRKHKKLTRGLIASALSIAGAKVARHAHMLPSALTAPVAG